MVCAVKRQLLDEYTKKVHTYSAALAQLNENGRMGSGVDSYAGTKAARLDSDMARRALEQHISNHEC
jgi:hypothetical protein